MDQIVPVRGNRYGLIFGGAFLVLVGLGLLISSIVVFESEGDRWFQQSKANPGGDNPMPSTAGPALLGFGGVIMMAVGGFLLKLGLVKPVASIVAADASPALGYAARHVAAGVKEGLAGGVAAVKVRCRSCGFLESEDARFCSQCQTSMA